MFTILGADGREYGPVTADTIHEWIKAGRANAYTKIKRTGAAEWTTIGVLPEFNPQPAALPPPLPPSPVPGLAAESPAAPIAAPGAPVPQASTRIDPASRWLRLGAALVDGIISNCFLLPGIVLLVMAGAFSKGNNPNTPFLLAGFGAFGLGALLLLAIQIYLLTTRGQTMGKKLIGIRIVRFEDGANPGFTKAFLLRSFVNALIGFVPLYSLVDICFIFRDDRRCIHDLLAGTVVVKA